MPGGLSRRAAFLCGLAAVLLLAASQAAPAQEARQQLAPSARPKERPVYREPDRRPQHDDARLKALGIQSYESTHLKLYTDVPAERVKSILPAVDAAYDALTEYFGPLPPTPEKTEFQVTGYLMADKELFRRTGLLPEDLPPFLNGRHRELEFWINEQETDYYRRHLAIHEFTHCFMFSFPRVRIPAWYQEGMAELFGTHEIDSQGHYRFRVMPDRPERFEGLGRIPMVRGEITQKRWKSLTDIGQLKGEDFLDNAAYGWAWAVCKLLDTHPRFARPFHDVGRQMTFGGFEPAMQRLWVLDEDGLQTEWALFSHHLQYGYDIVRASIDFQVGRSLTLEEPQHALDVSAGRGWQPSGVVVGKGQRYEITATGEVTLGTDPKPWVSQPQGLSIVYSDGRPIGMLLATVHAEPVPEGAAADKSMLKEIVIGPKATFVADTTGTLYLRINDRWGSLADNTGHYRVEIRALPKGP
jgi:hypothetical protein